MVFYEWYKIKYFIVAKNSVRTQPVFFFCLHSLVEVVQLLVKHGMKRPGIKENSQHYISTISY